MASAVPDNALALQWIFGGFVVFLYAKDRFRTPQPVRATTTFWRYWSAYTGYILTMLAMFVVLGGGITALDASALLRALGPVDEAQGVERLPGPLLAALMLTVLLPHFPMLGKIDQAVMEWFRGVGNIPFELRVLAGQLRESNLLPSTDLLERLRPTFRAYGLRADELQAPAYSFRYRFARIVALFGQVQGWENTRTYARYMHENRSALADIRKHLDELAGQLNESTLTELDRDADGPLAVALVRSTGDQLTAMENALCDFVAGGVLHGEWKHGQRVVLLKQMGFTDLPTTHTPLTAHDVVLVSGLIFLLMLFVPLALRRLFDPSLMPPHYRIYVMVPIIYAIAIVVAIYPKAVWSFAVRPASGARPVAAYALSGLVAAAAGFGVSLLFRFVFDTEGNLLQVLSKPDAFRVALLTSLARWPWLLMVLFATIAIAWAADDTIHLDGPEPTWLRAAETLALGTVFLLMQWLVLEMFVALDPEYGAKLMRGQTRLLVTSAMVGVCVGALVPYSYRQRTRGVRAVPITPMVRTAVA